MKMKRDTDRDRETFGSLEAQGPEDSARVPSADLWRLLLQLRPPGRHEIRQVVCPRRRAEFVCDESRQSPVVALISVVNTKNGCPCCCCRLAGSSSLSGRLFLSLLLLFSSNEQSRRVVRDEQG